MIDRLLSFGDSFIFGSDLADSDNKMKYSKSTWPALCAKELGLKHRCWAHAGCGNSNIAQNIVAYSRPNALVVINWSWIDRFDYQTSRWAWSETVRPDGDEISEFYYKNIHTDLDDKFRSLSLIHSTHEYLKNNNIKFISTYMDHLVLDRKWHCPPFVSNLQRVVRKDLQTFPKKQTFLEWSRSNGYPESKGWHPLEQAHAEAVKVWLPTYKSMISPK